jgi:hypothetical protein
MSRQQRALALLADNVEGATVPTMLAQGFTVTLLTRLIRRRLVRAEPQPAAHPDGPVEGMRLRITAAGRSAIAC